MESIYQFALDVAHAYPLLNLPFLTLQQEIEALTAEALQGDDSDLSRFHHLLACFNRCRMSLSEEHSPQGELMLDSICAYMEEHWIRYERERISALLPDLSSPHPDTFLAWFDALDSAEGEQPHPLFLYLAERAGYEELRDFLKQEMKVEAGLDTLVLLTERYAPYPVKLALARRVWEEMGAGTPKDVRGRCLSDLAQAFRIDRQEFYEDIHWAPLA